MVAWCFAWGFLGLMLGVVITSIISYNRLCKTDNALREARDMEAVARWMSDYNYRRWTQIQDFAAAKLCVSYTKLRDMIAEAERHRVGLPHNVRFAQQVPLDLVPPALKLPARKFNAQSMFQLKDDPEEVMPSIY